MKFELFMLFCAIVVSNGQFLTGENTDILDGQVSLSVAINLDVEQVRMLLSGPSDSWYAIGFGNSAMDGTYSILTFMAETQGLNGTEEISVIEEVILGDHDNGLPLRNQSLFILDDITEDLRRTIEIQRPIAGNYSFPTAPGFIDIISAKGLSNVTDYTTATAMDEYWIGTLFLEETSVDPIAVPSTNDDTLVDQVDIA
eukprot:18897_1